MAFGEEETYLFPIKIGSDFKKADVGGQTYTKNVICRKTDEAREKGNMTD